MSADIEAREDRDLVTPAGVAGVAVFLSEMRELVESASHWERRNSVLHGARMYSCEVCECMSGSKQLRWVLDPSIRL